MRLPDISLGKKIMASFAIMIVGSAAMGASVYYQTSTSETVRRASIETNLQLRNAQAARVLMARQENSLRGVLLFNTPYYVERVQLHNGNLLKKLAEMESQETDPNRVERLRVVQNSMNGWRSEIADTVIKLAASPDTRQQGIDLVASKRSDAFVDPAEDALDANINELLAQSDAEAQAQADKFKSGVIKMMGGVVALLLAGLLLGWLLTRSIAAPIMRLRDTMKKLSAGDRNVIVPSLERGDEVGQMAATVENFRQAAIERVRVEEEAAALRTEQAAERERLSVIERRNSAELQGFVSSIETGFQRLSDGDMTVRIEENVAAQYEPIRNQFNGTVEKLETTFGSVVTSIGSIRTGLGEISVASNDLAQRTEQQAASLEQTVAALAEVTRAVNDTAQDASRAQATAESANRNAAKGGEIVAQAVGAMRTIEQSSEKIGKIIGVIDEIAFQTNLLALNAGVEAARAGEAGRGFAVVAQEVRGLAQRSAEAAKEIKELISMSGSQVAQGVELVSASGHSLDEIIAEVGEMSRTVAEIARRAREQAVSLKEVQTAADQMDKVTQQNAAMVEQATAAAQSLATETDELARLISEFKLATSQRPSRARPAANAPSAPSARPRASVQMRPVAQGNAALKTLTDNWEEF
ncbi:methyl-accepting chemotaxis protein [Aureimonas sp. ME7]|uniref:methyl-accepting chemotaxis protein n=1 Tax=Aureimonas sp. ME7 TaxID=2744252 RepID=UPI0015F6670F|nr:methyl-accepting chemotaxis protein [Aureimonas sp. ME7]